MTAFIKTHAGLSPIDDEARYLLSRMKLGEVAQMKACVMRNGRFFAKWFVLVTVIFEVWKDLTPKMTHKGMEVEHSFEVFRKDITINAGYFVPRYKLDGSVTLDAMSISWAKMTEPVFAELYSATIDAGLNVLQNYTKADLESRVNQILDFA